jgi:HK97 family phage prohead protease
MTSELERRFTSVPVEIRTGSDRVKNTIGGYAAKFTPAISQNLGGFKEQIAPGAFNRSASQAWPDVQARYNHEDSMLLGTTSGGSLRLAVNETGLQYEVDMLDDAISERIYKLVQRGDVRQSSFAFVSDVDEWATDDTGFPLRTLQQVRLVDVAPVNAPAYLDTPAAVRSLAAKFDAPVEEVRQLAQDNQLKRFFVRTDDAIDPQVKTRRSAQAALAAVLALDPTSTV